MIEESQEFEEHEAKPIDKIKFNVDICTDTMRNKNNNKYVTDLAGVNVLEIWCMVANGHAQT